MNKILFIFGVLLIMWNPIYSQESTQNYIRTRKMINESGSSYMDEVVYYDGLGRPFQTVQKGITPLNKNLVSLQEYDETGRKSKSWLPITSASDYVVSANFISSAPGNYANDSRPYHQPVYESSPLNRVVQQYGPGAAWYSGHPITTEYLVNTASSPLHCINYSVSSSGGLVTNANYVAAQLYVTKVMDEDGNIGYTFTDRLERTVLTRQMKDNVAHDTYYVFDDYGNLSFVLQPMYQEDKNISLYAFQYKYDGRNRCIEKKLPGADAIKYVYDLADNLVFSQDGNQRPANKWTFYNYDSINRLQRQGECTDKNTSANAIVHIYNYYDDYYVLSQAGFNSSGFSKGNTSYGRGKLTGSITSVLGSSEKINTAYFYDIKGRVTQTTQSNLLGGYEVTKTVYTFTNNPFTVTHTHTATGKTTRTEVYTYTYDQANRVSKTEHTLNGVKVTLAGNVYDNFGRLLTQSFHGAAANKLTYAYNIRSWLTGIASTNFTQNLYYADGNNATKCYNGNISSMTWKGSDGVVRGYKLDYDGLNRMTNAAYGEAAAISTNLNRFTEKVTGYDKNGNIKALQRYGQTTASAYGLIDNLTYTLTGNQLNRVDDAVTASAYNNSFEFKNGASAASEYTYDANGNLTKDLNKGITGIQYNVLNLPRLVTFNDGSTITYTYSADGTKLRTAHKIGTTTTTTDYCGNVIYENGTAKQLLTEEGYVSLSDGKYHYYLKDHQGNNRVVINQGGTVEETSHYYPFGGTFTNSTNIQPYKYNGKELDTKKGLNWYDYGARHYDAALGRWHAIDLLNETNYTSGYTYCLNNPSRYIDVMGLDTISASRVTPQEWEKFNPKDDVLALDQVTITGNSSNASFGLSLFSTGIGIGGGAASTAAGVRYTERPWGSGYFTTKNGNTFSMSILDKQANGKYVRGVQGYRNAAKAAKYATKLPRRIGNYAGYFGAFLSLNNLIHHVNTRNVIDMAATLTSFAYWEIGAAYAFGSTYFDWVIMPNVEQIMENVNQDIPPMRNVYNPQTGMYDY